MNEGKGSVTTLIDQESKRTNQKDVEGTWAGEGGRAWLYARFGDGEVGLAVKRMAKPTARWA